jgi:hypothetical protein
MSFRQTETASVAAAKAGFSAATAYRIEQDLRLPSQKRSPCGRQRQDPLAAVWDSEVVPLLKSVPGLRPVAIFDEIRRRHPEEWLEQLVLNFGRNADAVIADADFNRAPEISRRHPLARRSIASLRRIPITSPLSSQAACMPTTPTMSRQSVHRPCSSHRVISQMSCPMLWLRR